MSFPRTVVTILSTNFAGSHFLSSMLGSHSRAEHLGEVRHLRKRSRTSQVACSRCHREGVECPLFRGVDSSNIEDVYDIVFSNCADQKSVLIDNSKAAWWAARFLGRRSPRMKYIHLIRDPRALVRRWWYVPGITFGKRLELRRQTAMNFPRLAIQAAFSPTPALYKWLGQNRAITSLIRRHALDHIVITYRDLALHPEDEVRRAQEWIGAPFEPGQLEYWKHKIHGSQKEEYEKGRSGFFDTRWKNDLPPATQRRIAASGPVRRYLKDIGLRLVEDGLTREAISRPLPAPTS
jgi:sulfotransferase family protein